MYGSHKKHSAGARNVKARAKRALLLPSNNNKVEDLWHMKVSLFLIVRMTHVVMAYG